jgi:hypothetical protein
MIYDLKGLSLTLLALNERIKQIKSMRTPVIIIYEDQESWHSPIIQMIIMLD